jgi:isopenicillin N synthase-like dioxygenase
MGGLPVVDLGAGDRIAGEIEAACRSNGFFYVTGHGVPDDLLARLDRASRRFFSLPEAEKLEIAMEHGGSAWRGFFPVGAELTSGRPDRKEGLYFGPELPPSRTPLHGPNLFPRQVPELRDLVLPYITELTRVAQVVLENIAVSLDLNRDYFRSGYTANPTVLFRIFHYPPSPAGSDDWGVGEHTDYGLVTLLAQDENAGLQVQTPDGWIDAPPIPGTFVCNIGDMLDRMTGGWYRSTPHRVRNLTGRDRLSFPFFLDPDFDAEVPPLPGRAAKTADGRARWDGRDLRAFEGTYGDYLVAKVSKVFPALMSRVGQEEQRRR